MVLLKKNVWPQILGKKMYLKFDVNVILIATFSVGIRFSYVHGDYPISRLVARRFSFYCVCPYTGFICGDPQEKG